MAGSIRDLIVELDFNEFHEILLNNSYYDALFPFLLIYALLSAALPYAKIFRSKKTGKPYKPTIVIISLVVAFFGSSFEISEGETLGSLMMMLFPNISAITIGILTLYLVGSMLNKNFFKNLFRKDVSSYAIFAVGVIGLGAIIYYLGIAFGMWDLDPFDQMSYWNIILAVAFLIMGVVFLFIDLIPLGLVFLLVFGVYVYNFDNSQTILELFIDPVIFIVIIFTALFSWMGSGKAKSEEDEREALAGKLISQKAGILDYGEQDSRIKDIIDVNYDKNRKKWKKRYGQDPPW